MYYLFIFFTFALLSFGILILKRPFFSFAYATSVLLNSMLENNLDESVKRKIHLQSLGSLLVKFGLLLVFTLIVVTVSFIPISLFIIVNNESIAGLDTTTFYFYLAMILGSLVLFLFPAKNQNKDYTGWSVLLHRMLLDNYNISASLFKLEKSIFKKKLKRQSNNFVMVTGLARGGTTALTNLLHDTNKFHSLSYSNMPFLLSANLWGKIYRPRKSKLKQRAHGDNIMFGFKTIEALEEYFFKVFLRDNYIFENNLKVHDIDENTYKAYLAYQNLLKNDDEKSVYLAKNNNFILRLQSLRKYNSEFKIILIFRNPLAHAFSLMNQHSRFTQKQKEDPFVLEYMNWLGHHEFGLNHKTFDLGFKKANYKTSSINYWLTIWINYYSYVATLLDDKHLYLVEYTDLCNAPNELLSVLGEKMGFKLTVNPRSPYSERKLPTLDADSELLQKAEALYSKLKEYKVDAGREEKIVNTVNQN